MSSAILTKEVAIQAVEFVRPAILRMMEKEYVKRSAFHIVILDPTVPFADGVSLPILHEESLGSLPRESWPHDFATYAIEKVRATWETGLDSHVIQQLYPYRFRPGAVKYGGSVNHMGILAGGSGVQWYYDQMYGTWVAAACRAISIQRMERILADESIVHLPEPSPTER